VVSEKTIRGSRIFPPAACKNCAAAKVAMNLHCKELLPLRGFHLRGKERQL
jgi:hypothetical protein